MLLLVERARRGWTAALLLFHAVLYYLTGILFIEGALLLFVAGGWGEPLARRMRGRPITSIYGIGVALGGLVWGLTRARVAELPGPAMVGLVGAWLALVLVHLLPVAEPARVPVGKEPG